MTMSIRERILAVYRNIIPDRIPISIYSRYHRRGEIERTARNNGLGILLFEPPVSMLAPPWHIQPGYVSEVKGASFSIRIDWENGEQIEKRAYETPMGIVSQCIVKDPSFGSDWIKKHYIETVHDYKVLHYIIENTVLTKRAVEISQGIKDLGEDGVVLGRLDRSPYQKLLIELVGPERLFFDLADTPKSVHELIEIITFRQEEQFRLALETNVDVIWQPDNVTADMTPPSNYRKFCLPIYQERGEACRAAGKVYAVHMDGKLAALKKLIAESPIDVIESFSLAEMGGDVSVEETREAWPGKVICPNFPASLAGQSKNEIIEYLIKLKMGFLGRPFMVQVSEDIPLSTYINVLPALCESVQRAG